MAFSKKIFFLITFCALLFINNSNAQKVYNKKIKAVIKVDKTSEFVTFSATSENLDLSDYSLRYELLSFKKDNNNNVSKSSQGDRFFLKASEKKILSSVTLNTNFEGKVTLVLLIYPADSNVENQGAIGKDRIVVNTDGNGGLLIELDGDKKKTTSKIKPQPKSDQDSSLKDGIYLQGLVTQKTITKSGRDFYRYFFSDYYNKQITTTKDILIEEVPGRRRSTRISVKIDNQILWQFFARPKKDFLKQMAATSLERCISYLQRLQEQKQSFTRY